MVGSMIIPPKKTCEYIEAKSQLNFIKYVCLIIKEVSGSFLLD